MKMHTSLIALALLILTVAGCSKPAAATDVRMAADIRTITNVILKQPLYKKAESGELGFQPTIPIVIGTNSDQRHYLLTWKEAKWQIVATNQ